MKHRKSIFLILVFLTVTLLLSCLQEDPLTIAVREGDLKTIQDLIENGADVNGKYKYGKSPLFLAAMYRQTEAVKLLIKKQGDVNFKDYYGDTPLHQATFNGPAEIVQILIKNGANVNAKGTIDNTPLHRLKNVDIAKLLIEKGCDINAKNKNGNTPLHYAASYYELSNLELHYEPNNVEITESTGIAKFLIEKGADLNAKNNDGKTPYDLAKTDEMKAILKKDKK